MNKYLLETKGLTLHFGGLIAINNIDLEINTGNIHGIIGPNGAGKTSLLNLVAAFHQVSDGSIIFKGKNITNKDTAQRARSGIRRTFQNLKIFSELTVIENVSIGLHATNSAGIFDALLQTSRHHKTELDILSKAYETLELVGLSSYANSIAGQLAYGHRRLLEIARAIVSEPDLLLLDEPAAGLNSTESNKLSELIKKIQSKGTTIILVEHHMDVVMSVCDMITVLNHGQKLAEGTPSQIQRNPSVIEAYLGNSPQ
jgi:branched-chain amino acid transport system ATP-binding protein